MSSCKKSEIREHPNSPDSSTFTGELGQPFGTPLTVTARIEQKSNKLDQGKYYLKILTINRATPKKQPIMRFQFAPGRAASSLLAPDTFSLFEAINGQEATILSQDQIAEINKGFVGSILRLDVYESGEFNGIPPLDGKKYALWQDKAFSFESYLVVLRVEPKTAFDQNDTSQP